MEPDAMFFKRKVAEPPKPAPMCEDCRFYRVLLQSRPELSKCGNWAAVSDDKYLPVTRTPSEDALSFCSIARMKGSACGPQGSLFEAKPEPAPIPTPDPMLTILQTQVSNLRPFIQDQVRYAVINMRDALKSEITAALTAKPVRKRK